MAVYIGISGYDYASWKARFYPDDLPRKRWLAYAASTFDSIELNGTFYSLKSPSTYASWAAAVPADHVFAIKGSRFITHMKQLHDPEDALANFYASGVLALGEKTGPFLWQLPERLAFDCARLERFFAALPRSSREAAQLAKKHDARVKVPLTKANVDVAYRHALEPRHVSFFTKVAHDFIREHDIAFVAADTAGRFPSTTETTSSFAYVRLHGADVLYASRYDDDTLAKWARTISSWDRAGLDVYAYFDNDALGHAPFDALRLREMIGGYRRTRASTAGGGRGGLARNARRPPSVSEVEAEVTRRRQGSRAKSAASRSAPRTRSRASRDEDALRLHP